MINEIKSAYKHCDKLACHSEVRHSFYVKDNDGSKCTYSNQSSDATLYIENKKQHLIDFIPIDHCLIFENNIKKCDLVVLRRKKYIWFIELKEVRFTGNRKRDADRKKRASKKAVSQIASTINDFLAKGIDINSLNVFALITFPPFINQSSPIDIPSSAKQYLVLKLANECGYTDLYQGNHIVI